MRCEDALNWLNARADGELPPTDADELDAHLTECAACRLAADGLPALDAELRHALAGRHEASSRLADRCVTAIRATTAAVPVSAFNTPQRSVARYANWWPALVGLAAGFLLAVALFRPWQSNQLVNDTVVPIEPVAHLAAASGPVEVRPVSQIESFTCPTGGAISQDSIVRTGPTARCEISTPDGNALRLDCNTEITLLKPGVVKVNRGRICCGSPPGHKGLEIQSAGGAVVAKPTAQLAFDCQLQAVRVIAVDGPVNVQTGTKSMEILPGKQLRIVQGKVAETDSCDPSLETAWVNSVLAMRSSEHPELQDRVNQLLANIGAAKLSLMYEDELRRLGDDGVPPLLAYLHSTRETPNVGERVTAAGIIADVAQPRWIPDLIELLTDRNAQVRSFAARGLERLTGRDQGFKADEWQTQSWATCEGPHDRWLKWWAANRDRYPSARREIPPTKTPPF